jgi:hypothetical protein
MKRQEFKIHHLPFQQNVSFCEEYNPVAIKKTAEFLTSRKNRPFSPSTIVAAQKQKGETPLYT